MGGKDGRRAEEAGNKRKRGMEGEVEESQVRDILYRFRKRQPSGHYSGQQSVLYSYLSVAFLRRGAE